MKIAFIREKYDPYGGAERFTQSLMSSLSERGIEVHIYTRKWVESNNTNFHVHIIGGPRYPSLLRQATFVFLVGRAIRKQNFDLVQSNERTLCQHIYRAGDGVHARWLELRANQQHFFRRLSIQLNPFHLYLLWLERKLFENPELKAVIVNSNMVRHEITSRFHIPESRIHTIYNGVDLNRFHPSNRYILGNKLRSECGIAEETPVLLFLGSGFERKGLSTLLHGMAIDNSDSHLWVVGKGKKNFYQRLARKLQISSRITFWGPQKDVLPFFAGADIFSFPTLYDPFPTAVLEAMASGLPVITTVQCGAAEIIRQGHEGFILNSPDAVADLSVFLNHLYHPNQRRVISINARNKAEEFPIDRTIGEVQHLYESLLENNRSKDII